MGEGKGRIVMKSEMRIGRKEEEKRKEKGRECGSEGEREQMQM